MSYFTFLQKHFNFLGGSAPLPPGALPPYPRGALPPYPRARKLGGLCGGSASCKKPGSGTYMGGAAPGGAAPLPPGKKIVGHKIYCTGVRGGFGPPQKKKILLFIFKHYNNIAPQSFRPNTRACWQTQSSHFSHHKNPLAAHPNTLLNYPHLTNTAGPLQEV